MWTAVLEVNLACINMEACFYRMAADFLKTDYLFLAVGVVGGACSDVEQTFVQVTKFSKREQLLDILKTTGNFFPPSYFQVSNVQKKTSKLIVSIIRQSILCAVQPDHGAVSFLRLRLLNSSSTLHNENMEQELVMIVLLSGF